MHQNSQTQVNSLLKIDSHPRAGGDPRSVFSKNDGIPFCAGIQRVGLAQPAGVWQQAADAWIGAWGCSVTPVASGNHRPNRPALQGVGCGVVSASFFRKTITCCRGRM